MEEEELAAQTLPEEGAEYVILSDALHYDEFEVGENNMMRSLRTAPSDGDEPSSASGGVRRDQGSPPEHGQSGSTPPQDLEQFSAGRVSPGLLGTSPADVQAVEAAAAKLVAQVKHSTEWLKLKLLCKVDAFSFPSELKAAAKRLEELDEASYGTTTRPPSPPCGTASAGAGVTPRMKELGTPNVPHLATSQNLGRTVALGGSGTPTLNTSAFPTAGTTGSSTLQLGMTEVNALFRYIFEEFSLRYDAMKRHALSVRKYHEALETALEQRNKAEHALATLQSAANSIKAQLDTAKGEALRTKEKYTENVHEYYEELSLLHTRLEVANEQLGSDDGGPRLLDCDESHRDFGSRKSKNDEQKHFDFMYKKSQEEAELLRKTLAERSMFITALETGLENLRMELATVRHQFREYIDTQEGLDHNFTAHMEDLAKRNTELQKKVETLEQTIERKLIDMNKLERDMAALTGKNNALTEEKDKLEQQLDQAKDRIHDLQEDIKQRELPPQILSPFLQQQMAEQEAAANKKGKGKGKKGAAGKAGTTAGAKGGSGAGGNATEASEDKAPMTVQDTINTLQAKLEGHIKETAELKEKNTELSDKLHESQDELQQEVKRAKKNEFEMLVLKKECSSLQERKGELEHSIHSMKAQCEKANKDVEEMKKVSAKKEADIRKLREAMEFEKGRLMETFRKKEEELGKRNQNESQVFESKTAELEEKVQLLTAELVSLHRQMGITEDFLSTNLDDNRWAMLARRLDDDDLSSERSVTPRSADPHRNLQKFRNKDIMRADDPSEGTPKAISISRGALFRKGEYGTSVVVSSYGNKGGKGGGNKSGVSRLAASPIAQVEYFNTMMTLQDSQATIQNLSQKCAAIEEANETLAAELEDAKKQLQQNEGEEKGKLRERKSSHMSSRSGSFRPPTAAFRRIRGVPSSNTRSESPPNLDPVQNLSPYRTMGYGDGDAALGTYTSGQDDFANANEGKGDSTLSPSQLTQTLMGRSKIPKSVTITDDFPGIHHAADYYDLFESFSSLKAQLTQLIVVAAKQSTQDAVNPNDNDALRDILLEKFMVFRAIEAHSNSMLARLHKKKEDLMRRREDELEKVLLALHNISKTHPREAAQLARLAQSRTNAPAQNSQRPPGGTVNQGSLSTTDDAKFITATVERPHSSLSRTGTNSNNMMTQKANVAGIRPMSASPTMQSGPGLGIGITVGGKTPGQQHRVGEVAVSGAPASWSTRR